MTVKQVPLCCGRLTEAVQRRIGRRFRCRSCNKLYYRDPYVEYIKEPVK